MKKDTPKTSPNVEQLRREIRETSSEVPASYQDSTNEARREAIELRGRVQFFELRGRWSFWLILWICGILLFQAAVAFAVGAEYLNYKDYQWFLALIFGQSFLQIIGMGVVVVKFLYK